MYPPPTRRQWPQLTSLAVAHHHHQSAAPVHDALAWLGGCRLRREVKILQHVSGGPHIVQLLEVVRDPDTKTPTFVFDLVDAISFKDLQAQVADYDVRWYMHQLLVALDFTHAKGIMHRDVSWGARTHARRHAGRRVCARVPLHLHALTSPEEDCGDGRSETA